MSFGQQLKSARKAIGLTQKQLADAIGAKHNSISNWENDQNRPDPDTIGAICGVLNISPNYLFENTSQIPPGLEPIPKMKRVPLLGTIACGEPILAEENLDGYVETPEEISADFALRCKGDSMINARILDGDLVFIRQQPEVENGEIAAVLIDNEATLKRVYKNGGSLVLQPGKPKYPPMVYSGEQLLDIRIIGKAVAFLSAVH